MKKPLFHLLILGMIAIFIAGCAKKEKLIPQPTESPLETSSPVGTSDEPYQLKGTFSVTNGFVFESYFVENAVALVDLHGFVTRDNYWELPLQSQVLGPLEMDIPNLTGSWTISLPVKPLGIFNDVDNHQQEDQGVQIFTVAYSPNFAGGPFSEGDDRSFGWPNYLASIKTDGTNDYEVTGGKLVLWAEDDQQSFPSGFGEDGLLFTSDDPQAEIPAGYSIVDLDQAPFKVSKEPVTELMLYEPKEFAVKDYSSLSYTESFDQLFEFVSKHYAFIGYPEIEPDWVSLDAEIRPRVEKAEEEQDADAFWLALRDFTWAFKDGHVGLSASEYNNRLFTEATAGGYGFALRELDDGRVVTMFVLDGSPADQVGMQVGAVVSKFNGKPIEDAITAVVPWTLPMSSDWDVRYQQIRYLLRAPLGSEAAVTFNNPGEEEQTVTIKAIAERDSFARTSRYFGVDSEPLLPVDFKILDSGIGYVRVNSYFDDLNLLNRLFQRALETFQSSDVPGIIIDLRNNSGGNPIGLAAFLTDQEIPMPQGYSYSEATGEFEKKGIPGRILPNQEQYRFDRMAVLVGPNCVSACEDEAYSFSQVPGMVVVGMYPTSGTMADVGDGQINMPDGITMQFPTERMLLADGSLFLQGKGVQPGLRVPVTLENVLSEGDEILNFAEKVVLSPIGAGVKPSASPVLESNGDVAESKLVGGTSLLEDKARETYSDGDFKNPGVFTYTISLSGSEELVWAYGWCASPQKFDNNWENIEFQFILEEKQVPADELFKFEFEPDSGMKCRYFYTVLSEWQAGENHLTTRAVFKQAINDGKDDFPAGEYTYDYTVYVKP